MRAPGHLLRRRSGADRTWRSDTDMGWARDIGRRPSGTTVALAAASGYTSRGLVSVAVETLDDLLTTRS